jgi:hypothetical protein
MAVRIVFQKHKDYNEANTLVRELFGRIHENVDAMTTIKVSCPTCGEVERTSRDITLRVCNHAPLSYYSFICPSCRTEVRKPADDYIISLLMSGGVRAQIWEVPAEVLEPKVGPVLNYDDLLDFVLQIGLDDFLSARAIAGAHRSI